MSEDRDGRAEDAHVGRGCHILDDTYTVTLWRFTGADIAPLRVMKLTWRNQFARLLNRRRDTTQMGNGRAEIEAIEYLRYTNLARATNLAVAEIARCK
jgi:hypothetical protein